MAEQPARKRRPRSALLASALALLLWPGPASAHPHVWIDASATFLFAQGKLAALRVEWTFDPLFSDFLRQKFDPKKTGQFDGAALAQMKADLDGAREDGYFIHLGLGDAPQKTGVIADFAASYRGKQIVYRFTVPLAAPVDPVSTPITLKLYDSSFYVDVALDKTDPVRFEGERPGCAFEIREDKANPIYFGLVFPQRIEIKCKKA
jgi:ABC-type uncharacterized transport system substrate-binding protein